MNFKTLLLKIIFYFSTHSFARRCVSTAILLSILFLAVYCGGIYGAVGLMTVVSTLALLEFYRLAEKFGGKPRTALGLVLGTALVPFFFYAAKNDGNAARESVPVLLGVAAAVILFGFYLLAVKKIPAWTKALSTFFGLIYIPVMTGFFALLAGLRGLDGVLLCVWIVMAAKFTDIGGLIIGCRYGKHKLAPNASPNKTWEGVAGGLAFSVVGSAALMWCFNHFGVWSSASISANFSPANAALCALPIAAVSVVSDLVESVIKRQAGEKDSGSTIPGIGGALDLLDSLLFSAPVGYLFVTTWML